MNPANGDALWYTADGELTTEFRQEDKVMTARLSILHGQVVLELPRVERAFIVGAVQLDGETLRDE